MAMRGRAMETAGNIRYPTLRQKLTSGATNAPGVNQRSVSPKMSVSSTPVKNGGTAMST